MSETGKLQINLGWELARFDKGLGKIKGGLKDLKGQFKKSFGKIAVSSASLVAGGFGLKQLANLAADQDKVFSNLAAELGAVGKAAQAVKTDIFEVNRALGLGDAKEAAKQLYEVRRASGLAGEELKQLTIQTGKFQARWADIDRGDAIKAQTALLREFKKQGVGVKDVGDAFTYLASKTGDLKGELGDVILEYSNQLREAGFSFKQTVSIFGEAITAGWSPDKAVDMFKETRVRLQGAETAAMKTLGKMGLSGLAEGLKKGEVKVSDAMEKIRVKLLDLPKGLAFQYGKEIFGTPFEDIGIRSTAKMLAAMNKSPKIAGGLDKLSSELGKRFSWKWNQAMSSMNNGLSRILDSIGQSLIPVAEAFGKLTDKMAKFAQDYPNLTKAVALGIPTFALLVGGVGLLSAAFTLLTGPVGLTVLAVGALSFGLVELETRTGGLSALWEGLKAVVGPSLSEIGSGLSELWDNLKSLGGMFSGLFESVTGHALTVRDVFKGIGFVIGEVFQIFVLEPIQRFITLFNQVGDTWRSLSKMIKEGFSLAGLKDFAIQLGKLIFAALMSFASLIPGGGFLAKIFGKLAPKFLGKALSKVTKAAPKVFKKVIKKGLKLDKSPANAGVVGAWKVVGGHAKSAYSATKGAALVGMTAENVRLGKDRVWGQTPNQAETPIFRRPKSQILKETPSMLGNSQPQNVYHITIHSQSRDVSEDIRRLARQGG